MISFHKAFHMLPKGTISSNLSGQICDPPWLTQWPSKHWFKNYITQLEKCAGAPMCWKHTLLHQAAHLPAVLVESLQGSIGTWDFWLSMAVSLKVGCCNCSLVEAYWCFKSDCCPHYHGTTTETTAIFKLQYVSAVRFCSNTGPIRSQVRISMVHYTIPQEYCLTRDKELTFPFE